MHYHKPIILIGFKSTGKTALGRALAHALRLDFMDLDKVIETHYQQTLNEPLTCRQIVRKHGIDYFRQLESTLLKEVLKNPPDILSVGGGTPLLEENQRHIARGRVICIHSPKGIVFERIMITGRPAFFPEGEEAYDAFIRIWEERAPIYKKLAERSIENTGTIEAGVKKIIAVLHEETEACKRYY